MLQFADFFLSLIIINYHILMLRIYDIWSFHELISNVKHYIA